MKLQTPPLLATLLCLAAFAMLCGLGIWQLQRLEWKTEILQTLDTELAKNPRELPVINYERLSDTSEHTRIRIQGHLDTDKSIKLGPRTHEGKIGYHIYTPFIFEGHKYKKTGPAILVNRGWVPQDWQETEQDWLEKPYTIRGLLTFPPEKNNFTPENNPDEENWYSINTNEITKHRNLTKINPMILIYEDGNPEARAFPMPVQTRPNLNNNHLQYAIFWFAMAGILIVIFILRFMRKT